MTSTAGLIFTFCTLAAFTSINLVDKSEASFEHYCTRDDYYRRPRSQMRACAERLTEYLIEMCPQVKATSSLDATPPAVVEPSSPQSRAKGG